MFLHSCSYPRLKISEVDLCVPILNTVIFSNISAFVTIIRTDASAPEQTLCDCLEDCQRQDLSQGLQECLLWGILCVLPLLKGRIERL